MNYYLISLPRSARTEHSARELTACVERLQGEVIIVDGRDEDVLTVRMDSRAADHAKEAIPFARVEDYYEMPLL